MESGREPDSVAIEFAQRARERLGSRVACLLRDEREWAASQGLPIGLNVAREGVAL